jgi:sulfatase maturation enzyme AslB (radical SAM superfamily)
MSLSKVHTLQMEPSTYCNAHCPHCPRFLPNGELHPDLEQQHLDVDKLIPNLHLEKMTGLKKVWLEGDKGDPTMNPGIIKLIDAFSAMENPPEVELVTNGSIRNEAWWAALAERKHKNLIVTFSIDGLEDTNHLYRVGLDYSKIMSNATAFINAGGNAVWKFIRFKHNEHQVLLAQEKAEHMGFAEFHLINCDVSRFGPAKSWPVYLNGTKTHTISYSSDTSEYVKRFRNKIRHDLSFQNNPAKLCPFYSKGHFYIDVQGYLLPCCMMHFDTKLKYPGTTDLKTLTGGFENQSLMLNTFEQVLGNDLFREKLVDSLSSGQMHYTCSRTCTPDIDENRKLIAIT